VLGRLYPKLYSRRSKTKLVCDAYEFAKHTRIMYPSVGNKVPLVLILFIMMFEDPRGLLLYLVRGGLSPLLIVTVWMTWLYLLSKDEVLECFKVVYHLY
jgi:hypothetical protein